MPVPGKWEMVKSRTGTGLIAVELMAVFVTPLSSYVNASKYVVWDTRGSDFLIPYNGAIYQERKADAWILGSLSA